MHMGLATVLWSCKKQVKVVNSFVEVKYISAWEASCKIVWLRRVLRDLESFQTYAASLLINN